jgi:hypothetical protein
MKAYITTAAPVPAIAEGAIGGIMIGSFIAYYVIAAIRKKSRNRSEIHLQ